MKLFKNFSASASMLAAENIAVKRAISNVIDRQTYCNVTGHPNVREFEKKLSEKLDGRPALGVNSGTDALILALKVLGIGPGDEVIVPALSYISTASCIQWVGATPVFVDICTDDYALSSNKIKEKISKKTKAIIAAHLFGQPATGTAEILRVAKEYNVPVIEDAAQSFGAKIQIGGGWRQTATLGEVGCLSFSSTKLLAAPGSGGAIIIKNQMLYQEADRMRSYGTRKYGYDYPTVGINCKMHDMQAAALLAKLPFFDYWLEHRKSIAEYYSRELTGIGDLVLPREFSDTKRTWYRYVIRTKKREALFRRLLETAGDKHLLQPTINYPVPLPYFEIFKGSGHKPGDFPEADRASEEVISLPITNYVTRDDARLIIRAVKEFFDG